MRRPGFSSWACSTRAYSESGNVPRRGTTLGHPAGLGGREARARSRFGQPLHEPVRDAFRSEADPRLVGIVLAEVPHAPRVRRVAAVANHPGERVLAARFELHIRLHLLVPAEGGRLAKARRSEAVLRRERPGLLAEPGRGPSGDLSRPAETRSRNGGWRRWSPAATGAHRQSRTPVSSSMCAGSVCPSALPCRGGRPCHHHDAPSRTPHSFGPVGSVKYAAHGAPDPQPAPRHRDRRRCAAGPRFLRRRAGPAPRQEDGELRQPQRLPLLLRRRDRHAGHDLDDVSVQGLERPDRNEGPRPGGRYVVFGARGLAPVLEVTAGRTRHYRR